MMSLPLTLPDDEGSAVLILPATDLPRMLLSLPASYRVSHSEQAESVGDVVLRVKSADLYGHENVLRVEIADAGSTRMTRLVPRRT